MLSDNTGEFNATEIWSKPLNIYACYSQLFSAILTRQTIFSDQILQLCVPRCFHLYILAFHIICTFSSVAFACYTIWKTDSNRFVTLAFTTDFFNHNLDMFSTSLWQELYFPCCDIPLSFLSLFFLSSFT